MRRVVLIKNEDVSGACLLERNKELLSGRCFYIAAVKTHRLSGAG